MLTQDQIKSERESVVGAALGWEHTPYHHMGEVKGAGADCVSFLRCAIIDARLGIEVSKLEYYPMDWHMHNDAERYMEGLMKYCVEMPATEERVPLPADIIL